MTDVVGEKRRVGRPPSGRGRLPIALTIKGNDAWKRWVEEYAEAKGTTPADLIDQALASMARRDKRPTPPCRVE
jgi:hypothetical protein